VQAYTPRGQTPILQVPLTRDHLSAISGITPESKLFQMVREAAFHGEDVVCFLRYLLLHLTGKLLILWDGSPIHRSAVVKQFLQEGGADRIHLEQLPGYAPDVNADKGIWHYLKRVELRNVCCQDLPHLKRELRRSVARLRHKRRVIQGCIKQASYP
jgi:transposase